jgi:hypothetical protein
VILTPGGIDLGDKMIVKVVLPDWKTKKIELPVVPDKGDDILVDEDFYVVARRLFRPDGSIDIQVRYPFLDSDPTDNFLV